MEVRYLYFDNDLDICPGPGEAFTWKPGDTHVLHWGPGKPQENSPYNRELVAAYNVSYIREIAMVTDTTLVHQIRNQPTDDNISPLPPEKSAVVDDPPETRYPPYFDPENPEPENMDNDPNLPPKLSQLCTCGDLPDPTCPAHRKGM